MPVDFDLISPNMPIIDSPLITTTYQFCSGRCLESESAFEHNLIGMLTLLFDFEIVSSVCWRISFLPYYID